MKDIYKELKEALLETKKDMIQPAEEILDTIDIDPDVVELNQVFRTVLSSRDTVFEKFENVSLERFKEYQTLSGLLVSGFYIRKVDDIIIHIFKALDLYHVIGGTAFENNLLNLIGLLSVGRTSENEFEFDDMLYGLVDYFTKFKEYLVGIYTTELTGVSTTNNNSTGTNVNITLNGATSKTSNIIKTTFYMLDVISTITNTNYSDYILEVQTYTTYLSYVREQFFNKEARYITTYKNIGEAISQSVDLLDVISFISNKKEQEDKSHFNDYLGDLDSIVEALSKYFSNMINLSDTSLEAIEYQDIPEKIRTGYVSMKEIFESLVYDTMKAIKRSTRIVNSYRPYFKLNTNYAEKLLLSITTLESLDFSEEEAISDTGEQIKFLFKTKNIWSIPGIPFKKFSEYHQNIQEYVDNDIYNSFLLYFSWAMNEFNYPDISKDIYRYTILNMNKKSMIDKFITSELGDALDLERDLMQTYDIRVYQDLDMERISPSLINISKRFNDINSISFDDAGNADFDKTLYYLCLTGLLEKKQNINKNIIAITDMFNGNLTYNSMKNYKMLYLGNIFNTIFKEIVANNPVDSVISEEAKTKMDNFIIMYDNLIYDGDTVNLNDSLINKYDSLHTFYYSNDQNTPDEVLEKFIEPTSDFIKFIKSGGSFLPPIVREARDLNENPRIYVDSHRYFSYSRF